MILIDKPKCHNVAYTIYIDFDQNHLTVISIVHLGDISGYVKMPHSKPLA